MTAVQGIPQSAPLLRGAAGEQTGSGAPKAEWQYDTAYLQRSDMRKNHITALAGLALAIGIGVPTAASAVAAPAPAVAPASADSNSAAHCEKGLDAAVREDNDAYAARDARRYEKILNPKMIFAYDGVYTYGRDAIMADARKGFAVPGWVWTYQIKSETMYGCHTGIAVLDTRSKNDSAGTDKHFAVTMTMVREHGKWTVAMDNVHLLPAS